MDSFDWKKLNSNVRVDDTKKKYYGQYYCSLKYFCPGGRIILRTDVDKDTIASAVSLRQSYDRQFNHGGSWRAIREKIERVDVDQLTAMCNVKLKYSADVKFRVEEPILKIYSRDESTIISIATELSSWDDKLQHVSRPRDSSARAQLDSGAIITKTDIGYKYKIMCKDGTCNNKESIVGYLTALEDQVKVSKSVWRNLKSYKNNWTWGIWFYANDPQLVNMLHIIEPGFVTNIHEMVLAE